ncbi:MAG: hypothetical protein JXR76_09050 [Deltaproteobacteria bacterium]|nr:hypothetical protein [Deltaproteobacteria bacterium]
MDSKVNVRWTTIGRHECLRFGFSENLTEGSAMDAIMRWDKAFGERPGEKKTLIWAAQDMKAYESGARTLWTNALRHMKNQIDQIWLVTTSNVVSMGASLMSVVIGIPIKTVKSEQQLYQKLQ